MQSAAKWLICCLTINLLLLLFFNSMSLMYLCDVEALKMTQFPCLNHHISTYFHSLHKVKSF